MTNSTILYDIGSDLLARLERDGRCTAREGDVSMVTFSTVELSKVFRCVESLSGARINGVAAKEFFDCVNSGKHSDDALYSKSGSLTLSRTSAVALFAGLAAVGVGFVPDETPELLKSVVSAEAALLLNYLASILPCARTEPEVAGFSALVYGLLQEGEYAENEIADRLTIQENAVRQAIHRLLTLSVIEPGAEYDGLCTWRGSKSLPRHRAKPQRMSLIHEQIFEICCRGSYLPKEIGRRTGLTAAKCAGELREMLEMGCVTNADTGFWTAQVATT